MNKGWLTVRPPLPPDVHVRPPAPRLPFPLEAPTFRLFSRVSHALHAGVRELGLGPGAEILAPAYHRGPEIEALCRAGVTCRFYAATPTLEPDERELDALIDHRVRALYLIHYLGFPQDAARWRRWCDDRALLLLEDATHAWLSVRDGRPVGSLGDLGLFGLSETFGYPSAVAIVSRVPPSAAARSGLARVIPRACDPEVGAIRRAHHAVLAEALGDLVAPPFAQAPAGASPFAFPLRSDGTALAARLERARIRPERFTESTLLLPVHQELRSTDLERIIAAVRPVPAPSVRSSGPSRSNTSTRCATSGRRWRSRRATRSRPGSGPRRGGDTTDTRSRCRSTPAAMPPAGWWRSCRCAGARSGDCGRSASSATASPISSDRSAPPRTGLQSHVRCAGCWPTRPTDSMRSSPSGSPPETGGARCSARIGCFARRARR